MATFLMAQAANLSWAPRNSHGDVSHGSTAANLSWVSQRAAMATFLMVQKAANFQKWPVFHGSMAPTHHGSQSDILLTDVAKAD